MKNMMFSALAVAVLMLLFSPERRGAPSAYGAGEGSRASDELIAFTSSIDDHREGVVVVDPRTRVIGVYHIDRDRGEISLRSVRNIHWDLQMVHYNSVDPKPQEIRTLLEQKN